MIAVPEILVLAGGFGTRLRQVVSDVPKPLAPIGEHPFLFHLIANWYQQGARKITLLLHHQSDQIERYLSRARREHLWPDCEFRTVTEPTPLGTGGALAYAIARLSIADEFLVANADTWLGSGIGPISVAAAPAIATVRVADAERYGMVMSGSGFVLAFAEKQSSCGSGSINAGLYKLRPADVPVWTGQAFSLERDVFPRLVVQCQLHSIELETEFIDIGVPEDYHRFRKWIEAGCEGELCN